ncbi:MAG: amidohydrolase family protein [Bacteroidetes bacterium]|nr:amidohydrolase family protein [Bacteroidota bacterium]
MRAILRGRLVIDGLHEVSENMGIVVDGGTILHVGKYAEIARHAGSLPVYNFDGILCPGLINAHTHLELSLFSKESFSHKDFVEWVIRLVESRSSASSSETHLECLKAKREVEKRGTSYFVNVGNDYDMNVSLGKNQLFQFEQIGINGSYADKILGHASSLIEGQYGVDTSLAVHAPYSVSTELMRGIKAFNNSRGTITSIHLAETADEVEFTRSGKGRMADLLNHSVGKWNFTVPGLSPVQYVDSLGVLDEKALCAHCVFVDDEDVRILKDRRSTVAVCIRSNLELSGEKPPLEKFRRNGIRILIGTDSKASSPDIDMFSEIAAFYDEFHDLFTPSEIISLATADAADFLGIGDHYGRIAAGLNNSIVYVPFDGNTEEASEFLVSEASGKTEAVEI